MREDLKELELIVDKLLDNKKTINVLEAGCGSMSHIRFYKNIHLTGLDISPLQLARNTKLDESILGDIQTYDLPAARYDLIVCWDVLEHIKKPREALKRFARAVAEDGIILLASPNVMSVRGLVVKYTPHWFHILFYTLIYKRKDAGKNDNPPFVTYFKFAISPKALVKFGEHNNLSVEYCKTYEIEQMEKNNRAFKIIWDLFNMLIFGLTFGKIGTDASESFMIVLKKTQANITSERK
jgi:SAM-dependent methyltransferase